jgi:hypothetical protein
VTRNPDPVAVPGRRPPPIAHRRRLAPDGIAGDTRSTIPVAPHELADQPSVPELGTRIGLSQPPPGEIQIDQNRSESGGFCASSRVGYSSNTDAIPVISMSRSMW